jgi:thiamine kinase-like enzyme
LTGDDLAVRSYVCEVITDCRAHRIQSVGQLPSGENHAVYRVSYLDSRDATRQVVVRVGSGAAEDRLRAEREARVLAKVGGVAGPVLYDFRSESPWFDGTVMCMELITGQQQELSEAPEQDMGRLGAVVAWLHTLPVDGLHERDLGLSSYVEERWQNHLASRLSAIRDPLPGPVQQRLRAAVALVSDSLERLRALVELTPDENLVLLHADISGANLIWAPQPVLIDWEYARLGDPADEVAYLFTQNQLGPSRRAAFWDGYSSDLEERPLDLIAERVHYWEPITVLGSLLWWLDAWSRADELSNSGERDPALPRPADYYLTQALRRLDQLDLPPAAPI